MHDRISLREILGEVLDLIRLLLTGKLFKELTEVKTIMNASILKRHKDLLKEKEQNTKISVVIPTLNESSFIENPIMSLKAGSYTNYEVIVVDSMSQDDTAEKARKLGAKVIFSKKGNRGYPTHLGFKAATGNIVVRTDADTVFPEGALADTAKAFEKRKIDVFHGGHLYYDGNVVLNLLAHLFDKYWRKAWNTTGHFIAVRKSIYEKVPFKPLPWKEDYDFGERAYKALGREAFAFDPTKIVFSSARAIRKQGLFRYLLRQDSYSTEE